ncbi:MAG: PAS domain S-box protein [Betaproteobacteria bacterium]|nr:PAS domain S-box protein [Betaproteobacteria bacterium]
MTSPPDTHGSGREPAELRGIQSRITAGFAAVALGTALLIGIIALRLTGDGAIPPAVGERLQQQLLWWGFGAVVLSVVIGMVVARVVGGPIRRLTDDLRRQPFTEFRGGDDDADYLEVAQLRAALTELAAAVRDREETIARSERRFRESFELIGTGLTQVDANGCYTMVNARFCEMLGYSLEELIGRNFLDVTHPDDRENDARILADIQSGAAAPASREKRYVRKDGSVMWAVLSGVAVRDADGNYLYALGSVEDVTRFRETQFDLQRLNESLRAVVQTAPLAIYSLTREGIVTLWNPAAAQLFGIGPEEAIGKPSPLRSSEHEARLRDLRERAIQGEVVKDEEISWTHAGGKVYTLSLNAAPLRNAAGEVDGILVICNDVTGVRSATQALDAQLHFIQELLEVIPAPIFYRRAEGQYLGFNRAWESFFGKRREDWIGKCTSDLTGEESARVLLERDREVLETGRTMADEVVVKDGRGESRAVVWHVGRFTDMQQRPAGIIGVMTDITDVRQVSEALESSERRFKALTESAMDIVTVLDEQGVIRYQSPSVKHLLGYEPAEMIGKNQFDLVHRDDAVTMRSDFARLIKSGDMRLAAEFRVMNAAGEWRTLESIGKNCLDDPHVKGIIVNTRDITDRKAIQERVQHLAYHDALTGLPNRLLMQDRIAQAIVHAQRAGARCVVMFIDIDNFKNINDTLGHDVGDDLLRQVALRLKGAVRAQDTIARQGGDEFIVLLDQMEGHQGATRVAQKILENLRAAFKVHGVDQHVSASLGIAVYPDDGQDPPTLLRNADTAMFHGKALGKNTYQFFTPQMNIAVKRRAAMETSLRAAVSRGDFALVYQPQIDLNTGEIVALEALVRWISEEGGTVMPGEFIPLAEETGLISDIGNWVLREACKQAVQWQRAGHPPRRMAINLSARQLADRGFIENLQATLAESGLSPQWLELEVTETQVMRQGEASVSLLDRIAQLGVHLAVDDFGTGYSSLSYLKRLPISKLKIDQSFVRDITVDPNDTAIVVAIINMAKSLDLEITAEGIETAGQLTLLRAKGCSVGQGFYFSVPASAEELAPLLEKRSIFEGAARARD